jgi:peptide/nickel transport system substrate-binding protein
VLLALAACSSSSSPASGSGSGQGSSGNLAVVTNESWATFDPAGGTIDEQTEMSLPVFDPLFFPSSAGQAPDLATSYQTSQDGKLVTITLRQGVMFQDGTPFNASAAVFNLQRQASPKTGSTCEVNMAAVKSVTATGQYTVQITLSSPDAALKALLSSACGLMASPTAVKAEGNSFGAKPVGTGPFKFASGQLGVTAKFVAFNGYWDGKPKLASVTFQYVSSGSSALAALQSGGADVWQEVNRAELATPIEQAKSMSSLRVLAGTAAQYEFITFAQTQAPFNDPRAREAVTYATDAAAISSTILHGLFPPFEGVFPPSTFAYQVKVPGYAEYNLAKAKALVAALGGLNFSLVVDNTPETEAIGAALEAQWAKAGINASLSPVDTPTWISRVVGRQYQASIFISPPAADPDTGTIFLKTNGPNITGFTDSELNTLALAGVTAQSQPVRAQIYKQLNEREVQDTVFNGLFTLPAYLVESNQVENLPSNPLCAVHYQNVSLSN